MDAELLKLLQAVDDANTANQNSYNDLNTARVNLKNYIATNYPQLSQKLVG